jgi:hypothetical protein
LLKPTQECSEAGLLRRAGTAEWITNNHVFPTNKAGSGIKTFRQVQTQLMMLEAGPGLIEKMQPRADVNGPPGWFWIPRIEAVSQNHNKKDAKPK